MPGNPKYDQIKKLINSIDYDQNLISSEDGQAASACQIQAINVMHSPENARKPQIWPDSLSQSGAKMRKINIPWPESHEFWRWSGYIRMSNIRPFLPCVLMKMPGNLSGWTDRWTDGLTGGKFGWLDHLGNGWSDRRMDRQKVPKCGGIKTCIVIFLFILCAFTAFDTNIYSSNPWMKCTASSVT